MSDSVQPPAPAATNVSEKTNQRQQMWGIVQNKTLVMHKNVNSTIVAAPIVLEMDVLPFNVYVSHLSYN